MKPSTLLLLSLLPACVIISPPDTDTGTDTGETLPPLERLISLCIAAAEHVEANCSAEFDAYGMIKLSEPDPADFEAWDAWWWDEAKPLLDELEACRDTCSPWTSESCGMIPATDCAEGTGVRFAWRDYESECTEYMTLIYPNI